VLNDAAAWTALYTQYVDLVRHWLGPQTHDADEAIALTFERFWRAVDAAKFARFSSLGAVLQYLKMCTSTVQLDRARAARRTDNAQSLDDIAHLPADGTTEEAVTGQINRNDLWRAVQSVLTDEREWMLVRLSYVAGLRPREICARYPTHFPDVAEVYSLKRNLLDRLRRAPVMQALLDPALPS
jgi:DNA-directed RNA polymerase specialized sigma24 family protein